MMDKPERHTLIEQTAGQVALTQVAEQVGLNLAMRAEAEL
jgi:hypothetical protein